MIGWQRCVPTTTTMLACVNMMVLMSIWSFTATLSVPTPKAVNGSSDIDFAPPVNLPTINPTTSTPVRAAAASALISHTTAPSEDPTRQTRVLIRGCFVQAPHRLLTRDFGESLLNPVPKKGSSVPSCTCAPNVVCLGASQRGSWVTAFAKSRNNRNYYSGSSHLLLCLRHGRSRMRPRTTAALPREPSTG